MNLPRLRIHPVLLLFLMAAWGAGGLYLFSSGVRELFQIDREAAELITKGDIVAISEHPDPLRIHFGWRLGLGAVSLGLAIGFFRLHYWRREF
ncbi:MAG: hypothetical protein JNM65_00210 [Verrucomicrobiaceae bacterium]|nr:hypothetical protein [Verrucomicrobiaceae bacterium]